MLGSVRIRGLQPIPGVRYRIRVGLGAGWLRRVETKLSCECRCGEMRRKWGIWLREGGNGRCKRGEIMGGRLGRGGGRNCAQDLREGRNEGIVLGKVSIEILC